MVKKVFLLLLPFLLFAQNGILQGKVVSIADGDTFTLLTTDNKQHKIRLYGIDCPEKNQAYGTRAKQFISELIFGKEVTVYPKTIDKYGRTIGEVFLGDRNINHELVENGYAWWYRQYSLNDKIYGQLENEAKQYQRGLWHDENPIPPWDFRKGVRSDNASGKEFTEDKPYEQQYQPNYQPTGTIIFNTRTRKYHCPSCSAVPTCTRNCIKINASELPKYGGTPCKRCGGRCR